MRMELRFWQLDKLYKRRDRIEIPGYQREKIWNEKKQQKFIDTLLKGWHTPKLYFRSIDDESWECVDGHQRISTIFRFFSGELPLSRSMARSYDNKYYYNELPLRIQDKFDDYTLHIQEIVDASDEDVTELFKRLQLGVPVNAAEKLHATLGDMRDFVAELSNHTFIAERIALRNYRYTHEMICAKLCLLEMSGIGNLKFEDLEDMYKKHKTFNKKGRIAKKVIRVLDFLERAFPEKTKPLRNRASGVSIYFLVSTLMERTSLKGMEIVLGEFYVDFLERLATEVEKGPEATDAELLVYQSSVIQAADSKESIRKRHRILMNNLVKFHPQLKEFVELEETEDVVIELEKLKELDKLRNAVVEFIVAINKIYSSNKGKDLFKATTEAMRSTVSLNVAVESKETFKRFVDSLYKLIYEGSGSLKRIPQSYKESEDFVGFQIKHLRTDLFHDYEHGKPKDIEKKRELVRGVYETYTGKTALESLDSEDYRSIQKKLLNKVIEFLEGLKSEV
jgi:hypothetical protein